jgi:DNA-binding HxlR family transcriptional regulator
VPGQRRFTDLIDGLPGISRKLLTERLRDLERDDIVARRQLPPPAARQVYQLTDDGRDLASAMGPLIRWGVRRLGERRPGESFNARSVAVGLAGVANPEAARGVIETYQYVVGDSTFHFSIDDGSVEVHDGRASEPAVTVITDDKTWADIAAGELTTSAAIAAGRLTVAGDRQAEKRLRGLFSRKTILGTP